jgi:hypothetical protein
LETETFSFGRFASAFQPDAQAVGPFPMWSEHDTRQLLGQSVPAFTAFINRSAHSSFNSGLFRVRRAEHLLGWNQTNGWRSDWPQCARLIVFASDWRGRLFGFDLHRKSDAGPPIAMLDAGGAGQLFEMDASFLSFINVELTEYADDVVDAAAYRNWLSVGHAPVRENECVGYQEPLFLGGADDVPNMQVTDLDVYVSLSGQLMQRVAGLPAGSGIGRITIS